MNEPGYHVPANSATATLLEKKSEFIAHLAPAETEAEALAFLESIRAKHRTANHNVYAYVLRQDARARYSDDGEPGKTAGLPVLSAIQYAALFNCIVVVTRYFGGTKLGTGGLVRAYSSAASAAIQAAGRAVIRPVRQVSLTLPYPLYEPALRVLNDKGARALAEPTFTECVQMAYLVPAEEHESLVKNLRELLRGNEGIAVSEIFDNYW